MSYNFISACNFAKFVNKYNFVKAFKNGIDLKNKKRKFKHVVLLQCCVNAAIYSAMSSVCAKKKIRAIKNSYKRVKQFLLRNH